MEMKNRTTLLSAALLAALNFALLSAPSLASNCNQTSVSKTPINDLGAGLYLNQFQGGLYPNGVNDVPAAHAAVGVSRAHGIQPLNLQGQPSPTGRYVLLSIGMSNTTQEFCSQNSALPCDPWTFMGQAAINPNVNHDTLAIVNGAAGGQAALSWDSPADLNYDRVRDTRLIPQGLSEAQVQAVWVKEANISPTVSLPNANADAYALEASLGNIARAIKVRYPNVKLVFFTSRIYAGYASTNLNPEPYAYESAFAIKWLIEAQINQMASGGTTIDPVAGDLNYDAGSAPWLAWGPYPWADGLTPRSDGLIWQCADLQSDGTHPSMSGEQKIGAMLLDFMLTSPFAAPWFHAPLPGDVNNDGVVNADDLLMVINHWGQCPPPPQSCPPDIAPPPDGNGVVNVDDLLMVINHWG